MKLLEFMNANSTDWQQKLARKPYCLEVRQDGDYFILKYNIIESDFSLEEVREARGSIFRFDRVKNEWICVCYPFYKFFNYGESYAATSIIDWRTATVQQKVDGSLIKFWYDRNEWHVSTNGTIDAFKAECAPTYNFGELVNLALHEIGGIVEFCKMLDTNFTYMFELTSPYNHIVIGYEGIKLWYLGRRCNFNFKEDRAPLDCNCVFQPETYPHHSLAECIEAAHNMGIDEEGYVVCDGNFNRIKVKGDEYLKLHKMRGNGAISILKIIELWQTECIDDFTAYYPEYKELVDEVIGAVRSLIEIADLAFSSIAGVSERRDFARYANSYIPPVRAYLFARLDNKFQNAYQFFYTMRPRTLASHIAAKIGNKTIGVKEDE